MPCGERGIQAAELHDSSPVFATVLAHAVNLEGVARGFVMVLAADVFFQAIDFRREEFDGASAGGADHVVMATAVVLMLVARNAIVKGDFAGESALGKQLERAINRCDADAWITFAHELVKLFDREVLVSFEKGKKDGIALLGPFQADAFQVLLKTILRLAQPFLRNRDGIIDAFLQHFRAFLA